MVVMEDGSGMFEDGVDFSRPKIKDFFLTYLLYNKSP